MDTLSPVIKTTFKLSSCAVGIYLLVTKQNINIKRNWSHDLSWVTVFVNKKTGLMFEFGNGNKAYSPVLLKKQLLHFNWSKLIN